MGVRKKPNELSTTVSSASGSILTDSSVLRAVKHMRKMDARPMVLFARNGAQKKLLEEMYPGVKVYITPKKIKSKGKHEKHTT